MNALFNSSSGGFIMITMIFAISVTIVIWFLFARSIYLTKVAKIPCPQCGDKCRFSRKEHCMGEGAHPYSMYFFRCGTHGEFSI